MSGAYPWRRIAITAGAIVVVTIITGVYRYLDSHGAFTSITPGFHGTCRTIASPEGPEDIVFDGNYAFVSALDRRAMAAGKASAKDGLYLYDPSDARLTKEAGMPPDFHPHGISLSPDGSVLFAINHVAGGQSSIDVFRVSGSPPVLAETDSIGSGLLISPNAIAAVDSDRFYVVNDHTDRSGFLRGIDDALALPRGNILYFDGTRLMVIADRVNYPNGIALSPDGAHLYVTEAYARTLLTFERNPFSGELKKVNSLSVPAVLDDIRVDRSGNLWIAGRPDEFAMARFRNDPNAKAPSEIFRVIVMNGVPVSATPVYADKGGQISGSSVGAYANGRLLIGSAYESKILDCRLATGE
jgi:arylesterase / paraoxonase